MNNRMAGYTEIEVDIVFLFNTMVCYQKMQASESRCILSVAVMHLQVNYHALQFMRRISESR